MQTLYRFYDRTERLLYVGITSNPPARFVQHRQMKQWWELVETIKLSRFDTRREVIQAEAIAIRDEEPIFNVSHPGADDEYLIGHCTYCRALIVYEAADEFTELECSLCNETRCDAHAAGAQWGMQFIEGRA